MKYTIKLGGRGADVWVTDITEEQKTLLQEANVESPSSEYDDIAEILGKNPDDSDDIYTGVYDNSDSIVIEVLDESGNVVFDSTETKDWYFDEDAETNDDSYESLHEDENKFFCESYSKGVFFDFELECDEFDPKKLSPKVTEIGERFQLITGLYYEGKELEFEYNDYWGKGYYYYLG